jgi:hypothetical protein
MTYSNEEVKCTSTGGKNKTSLRDKKELTDDQRPLVNRLSREICGKKGGAETVECGMNTRNE